MMMIIYYPKYRNKTNFSKKVAPLTFLNGILKKGKITIEAAKESQKDFNKYVKRIQGLWTQKRLKLLKHVF